MTTDRREFLQAAAAQLTALADPGNAIASPEAPHSSNPNTVFAQSAQRAPHKTFSAPASPHIAEHHFSQYQLRGLQIEKQIF
jgi:hypothetical protein